MARRQGPPCSEAPFGASSIFNWVFRGLNVAHGRRGARGTKLFCSKHPVEGVTGLQTGQYRLANRSQLDLKVVRLRLLAKTFRELYIPIGP